MTNTRAIFIKQIQSLIKNPTMLAQAIAYLAIVAAITFLIGLDQADDTCDTCIPAYVCASCLAEEELSVTPDPSMVGLFTLMFVGLATVGSASALVMEDKTTHNLRFMTMAGVKPFQYLLGTIPSIFVLNIVIIVLFSIVGGYFGMEMLRFVSIAATGALVSTLLGVAIGLSRAPVLAAPFSIVLGMGPMLSTFNDTLARYLRFTYTQQINLAVSDLYQDMSTHFMIIGANGAVILLAFIWMHRKGELRW